MLMDTQLMNNYERETGAPFTDSLTGLFNLTPFLGNESMKFKRLAILLLFIFLAYNFSVHYHHCDNHNIHYDCFISHAVYGNSDFLIYDS